VELIAPGRNGILVVEDPGEVFTTVAALADNPKNWQRLSAGAYTTVQQHHSLSRAAYSWAKRRGDESDRSRVTISVQIPKWLRLPPVLPEFAREDLRRFDIPGRARELVKAADGKWRSTTLRIP
jgi:hypothetical protein